MQRFKTPGQRTAAANGGDDADIARRRKEARAALGLADATTRALDEAQGKVEAAAQTPVIISIKDLARELVSRMSRGETCRC